MVKAILAHKSFFLKNSTALNIFSGICIQQIEYTKSRLISCDITLIGLDRTFTLVYICVYERNFAVQDGQRRSQS